MIFKGWGLLKGSTLLIFLLILPLHVWASFDIENAYPEPELKPNDVVRLQLLAMQQNDESNIGIEVTFRFASPANKKQTPEQAISSQNSLQPFTSPSGHK